MRGKGAKAKMTLSNYQVTDRKKESMLEIYDDLENLFKYLINDECSSMLFFHILDITLGNFLYVFYLRLKFY